MRVRFASSAYLCLGMFDDFVRLRTVPAYLEAVVDAWRSEDIGAMAWLPKNCSVMFYGKQMWLVRDGKVDRAAGLAMRCVSMLPSQEQMLDGNRLVVKADGQKGELMLSWR